MTPEEILEERHKIEEFKKVFGKYPLTPDQCYKGVNLREILEKHTLGDINPHGIIYKEILESMKDACDQIVDLCAENAKVKWLPLVHVDVNTNDDYTIDRESILNVKNFIK